MDCKSVYPSSNLGGASIFLFIFQWFAWGVHGLIIRRSTVIRREVLFRRMILGLLRYSQALRTDPKCIYTAFMTFVLHPQLAAESILIGSFDLSLLLMIKDAAYPWFVLVPQVADIKDAHELTEAQHLAMTRESRALSQALMAAFKGEKMNVAALGNMVPQLHIHHIVRAQSDAAWPGPIWGVQALTPLSAAEITARKLALKPYLGADFKWA